MLISFVPNHIGLGFGLVDSYLNSEDVSPH